MLWLDTESESASAAADYVRATIVETGPGNWRATITVGGTSVFVDHSDRDGAKALVERWVGEFCKSIITWATG